MTSFGIDQDILNKIVGVLQQYPIVECAGIFGSRGRGDYKDYSDIDISLHGAHIDTLGYMDIKKDLGDLPIIYKIDVVHIDSCGNPDLAAKIKRDEKFFYIKD